MSTTDAHRGGDGPPVPAVSDDPRDDGDGALQEAYGRLISHSYPQFLNRLGLHAPALRALGAVITDAQGRQYIDCVGGYGVLNVGHNHPAVVEALIGQLREGAPFARPLICELQVSLARLLEAITPGDLRCSCLYNSGSEAVDSAIKLARLCRGKPGIVAAANAFHGMTFGALAASGIPGFRRPFEPMMPGVTHVPYGDAGALAAAITPETAAVLLEPIQHEAGVVVPEPDYLAEVRAVCAARQVILILDEVNTGFGKTGSMFACEHFHVVPDILVLGKSMGGGLMPTAAIVAREFLWKKFSLSFPMSASSYGGNPLACCAAVATIGVLKHEGFMDACREKAATLIRGLTQTAERFPRIVKGVTGLGLLIGVETVGPGQAAALVKDLIAHGVLALPAFANRSVVMVEPPLVIEDDQIARVREAFRLACGRIEGEGRCP